MQQRLFEFITNHYIAVGIFILALIWLLWEEFRHRGGVGGRQLSSQALTHLLNRDEAQVLDIRDANAFKDGHIVGAINIPFANIEQNIKRIEKYKQKNLVVVCDNGQKSLQAISKLRKLGFTELRVLAGGIAAWKNANMPLVKK